MFKKKLAYLAFRIIRWFIKLFYLKIKVEGKENLPEEPSIIVANHTQMNGPLACEFYFPGKSLTWCAGEMMEFKKVPEYAFDDFWSEKPAWTYPFYKVLSYIIAPLSVLLFNNAKTIGVYRGTKIAATFKTTVRELKNGANVIIFPEHNKKYNNIIYDFQDKFIDIARLYYKKTSKEINFVPMYIAPKLKKMYIGKPVCYNANSNPDAERRRICDYLMDEITDIARALPEHTVVPYRNIPKKDYPKNRGEEYEKTSG